MKQMLKRLMLALLVSVAVFGSSGCTLLAGSDGAAYGSYDWPGYTLQTVNFVSNSGFPTGATYNVYYKFTPGSYYFYYRIYDGYSYSPYSSGSYEYVSYTVSVNKGSLFTDGIDKYFDIYLGYYGEYYYGFNIKGMGEPVVNADGSRVYSNAGYTITLKTSKVDTLPVGAEVVTFTK
ncbi:MAG: hypothetical protein WCT14_21255 [Treponemataceae bacterium]